LAYVVLCQQYDLYVQLHCSKTLYEVLNVPKTATDDEIKKAYRQLSLKVHPDRWMTADVNLQQQATKNQARVSVAFNILSERRAEYDRAGCPYDLDNMQEDDEMMSEFEDDMWAASESEASETDGEDDSPPPRQAGRGGAAGSRGRGGARGAARGGARGAARGGSAAPKQERPPPKASATRGRGSRGGRGGSSRGGPPPPDEPPNAPPAADPLICRKTITASLYQLYRGFNASVTIDISVEVDGTWRVQTSQMHIVIPPRSAPGLVKILRQAGLYRPGLNVREDVYIHVVLDDVVWPFAIRGQDLVVNHSIDLDMAIRGRGQLRVAMPDGETESFDLTDTVHELQEVSYQGRGLKWLELSLVGCVILRFHVVYPRWTVEQRMAVADFMQDIENI
jgi:DnaJ-class molecular chaperone